MTPSPLPWFRVYNELIDDKKFIYLANEAGLPWLSALGLWTALLCLAGLSPHRGKLYVTPVLRYSNVTLAAALQMPAEQWVKIAALLIELGMLYIEDDTFCIANWEKRQPMSDSGKLRVAKWREKHKSSNDVTDNVTLHATLPVTDNVTLPYLNSIYLNSLSNNGFKESEPPEDDRWHLLSVVFVNETGIRELSGGNAQYIQAIDRMVQAGIEPGDIRAAIAHMKEKGLNISGPWSVEKTATSMMSNRLKPKKVKREVYTNE
jgi:hypothetical protein